MNQLSICGPVILALAMALTPPAAIGQSVTPLSPEHRGPHRVGFTVRWIDPDSTGRPGRLLIWYPADTGGALLRFGDYLAAGGSGGPTDWAATLTARELDTGRRQFSPASDSLWSALARLPVAARRDPLAAPGAHRLVLHLLGLGDWSLESTLLWERLASEGFIVGVVSQVPETLEGGFPFGVATIQRQLADAERGLAALRRFPGADPGTRSSWATPAVGWRRCCSHRDWMASVGWWRWTDRPGRAMASRSSIRSDGRPPACGFPFSMSIASRIPCVISRR